MAKCWTGEGKKYTFWKFHLLVVTLTKEEVLVSNSKVWSTLYNQCIRQSINRCGKKELVSTVLLTPLILRKVSQVSHRVLLQELKFTTTFNVIHVLYLFLLLLLFVFTAVARRLKQALFIHSFIWFAIYTKFTTQNDQNGNNMRLKKK